MAKKPTYEELEQRVRELEKESLERKLAGEALIGSKNRTSLLKVKAFPPWFTFTVSLVLAICIIFILGHLVGDSWLKLQEPVPHPTTKTDRIASQPDGLDRSPAMGEPLVYPQGLPDREEDSQETRDIGVAEAFSSQEGLYEEAPSAGPSMPEPKADPSTAEKVVIQVGAFREKANAEPLLRELKKKGYDTYLEARIVKKFGFLYLVRLRGYASESAARTVIDRLEKEEGLNEPFTLTLGIVSGSSQTPAL